MKQFSYKARDASGRAVKGILAAQDQSELVAKLHRMGYITTEAKETGNAEKDALSFLERFRRVSAEELLMFIVQLSNMINAGITILVGLDSLAAQTQNKKFKNIIEDVAASVESGDSFSQALSRHGRVFPPLLRNMVRAGEVSGKLDTILARYAEYSEKQADLEQKVKGALFYPFILLVAGVAVILFIVTFIIPQFAEMFAKTGIKLPAPTLILYHIGIWIKHFWPSIFLFGATVYFAVQYYIATPRGRLNFDRFVMSLPAIGPFYRKAALSRFARTLSTLVSSGVSILESFDTVKDVIANEVMARSIADIGKAVEKGERISETMKMRREFPQDMIQLIHAGEETGNLDGMLAKIADFYDRQIEYAIKKMTTLIEPIFLVIMGSLVGFIMASMLLPIFDMIKILKR